MSTGPMLILLAQGETNTIVWLVVVGICLAVLGVMALIALIYGNLWFQAYMSGADVRIHSLIGMGFRQVNPRTIIRAKVMAAQAGLKHQSPDGHFDQPFGSSLLSGRQCDGCYQCHYRGSPCRNRSGL